jgi:PAS domain S-box-containing protein
MQLSFSLSRKGLFLVAVPLICQVLFVTSLIYLQDQAEREAARVEHAKKISDATNELIKDIFDIIAATKGENLPRDGFDSPKYKEAILGITGQLDKLKDLVQTDPKKSDIVSKSRAAADNALVLLNRVDQAYRQGNAFALVTALRTTRKDLQSMIKGIVSSDLVLMAREEREVTEQSPEIQANMRHQARTYIIIFLFVNVAITLALARFLRNDIISRLNILTDNSYRLASRQALHEPLQGEDEIAQVDHTFHRMAEAIEEAARKESAMIENAVDVICSLDARGTFVSVSPASKKVFGYTPSEMIGSKLVRLVFPDDFDRALLEFQKIMQGGSAPPIETRVLRKDGSIVDILWSAHWSKSEGSMFCVAHDVTERKKAEQIKQEVLAMVSHDLRTPLATVRSFLEMLETGMFGDLSERGQHLLKVADRSTLRMLTLIKDLLDIERMEAGMLELHKQSISLNSVLDHSVQSMQSLANEKTIQMEVVPTSVMVEADEDRLVQIVVNLLTNAIKFSQAHGTVRLCAIESKDWAEITVQDQGRGIPKTKIKHIFDRFKQVESSDATEKGGTGLGLAICKALVELHGGTIQAQSEEGHGSTFTFRIPKIAGKAQNIPSAVEPPVISSSENFGASG